MRAGNPSIHCRVGPGDMFVRAVNRSVPLRVGQEDLFVRAGNPSIHCSVGQGDMCVCAVNRSVPLRVGQGDMFVRAGNPSIHCSVGQEDMFVRVPARASTSVIQATSDGYSRVFADASFGQLCRRLAEGSKPNMFGLGIPALCFTANQAASCV